MIPQALLNAEEIENEIIEICKDKKSNQLRRVYFEQKLQKMLESNDIDIFMNGYLGFAHLATMVDNNITAMQNYMNKLGQVVQNTHYYATYSYFFFLFEELEKAKEKLLLALDSPVVSYEDFQRIIFVAEALNDYEINKKIIEQCKKFSNTEEYALIQMELGEISPFDFNKKDYVAIDLNEFFNV